MKCLINKLKESEGEDIKKLIKKKILSIKLGLTPLGLQIINDILYYIKIWNLYMFNFDIYGFEIYRAGAEYISFNKVSMPPGS